MSETGEGKVMYTVMFTSKDGESESRVFVESLPDRRTADHIAVQLFDEGFVSASWVAPEQ